MKFDRISWSLFSAPFCSVLDTTATSSGKKLIHFIQTSKYVCLEDIHLK